MVAAEGPSEATIVPKKVSPETFSRTEVGALSEPRIIAASSGRWRQAYNGPLTIKIDKNDFGYDGFWYL
jgi:hypothetical protein